MQVMNHRGKYLTYRWYVRWYCKFLRLWLTTAIVAQHTGIPKPTISSWSPRRKSAKAIKKAIPLLGLASDAAVGRKVGLSASCIRDHRRYRGIRPYRMSDKQKTAYNRRLILDNSAEKQVAHELMNSWKAP